MLNRMIHSMWVDCTIGNEPGLFHFSFAKELLYYSLIQKGHVLEVILDCFEQRVKPAQSKLTSLSKQ
jgi:hypothetical protein